MFKKLKISFSRNYFEYALYLFVCSFFLGNAPISIAYMIFVVASIPKIYYNFKLKDFLSHFGLLLPCIFFLFNLVLVILLGDSIEDVLKAEKIHSLLIFPIIFFSARDFFKQDKKIIFKLNKIFIYAAFISFSLSFIYGLFRMFFAEIIVNTSYITYSHLAELFGVQPIYMSVFYLMAIVFCFDLIQSKSVNSKKYTCIAICLLIGIILLSSRTSILLTVIVLLIKLSFNLPQLKTRKAIMFLITLFVLGSVLTISIPTLKNRVTNFNKNVSSYSGLSFRTKIWKNSFKVFKDSPIYGHGLYLSQDELMNRYRKVNFRRGYLYNLNAHNQYLQTLLDSGILGLLILLLMLLYPLKGFLKTPLSYTLFTIIIIISLISESFFLRQYGVLFFSLFTSIFYILKHNKSNT